MKLNLWFIIASLGLLLCSSCNPDNWASTEWFIRFQNDSAGRIWVTTGCKKENGKIFLTTEFPFEGDYNKIIIEPGQNRIYTKRPYRDMVLNEDATLAIFIISDEVYNSYTWEEIGEKELFLKKYVFRYGDMPRPVIYPNDYD